MSPKLDGWPENPSQRVFNAVWKVELILIIQLTDDVTTGFCRVTSLLLYFRFEFHRCFDYHKVLSLHSFITCAQSDALTRFNINWWYYIYTVFFLYYIDDITNSMFLFLFITYWGHYTYSVFCLSDISADVKGSLQ